MKSIEVLHPSFPVYVGVLVAGLVVIGGLVASSPRVHGHLRAARQVRHRRRRRRHRAGGMGGQQAPCAAHHRSGQARARASR